MIYDFIIFYLVFVVNVWHLRTKKSTPRKVRHLEYCACSRTSWWKYRSTIHTNMQRGLWNFCTLNFKINMLIKSHILRYFVVSNLIENVYDNDEAKAQAEFLVDTLDMPDEKVMYLFHKKMNYLNSYCKAWRLRDYDVFVGGRKCLLPKYIPEHLRSLFWYNPKTYLQIKEWHVLFEKIHPFGDWNGRTGRLLMLRHFMLQDVPPPCYLCTTKNFEANRSRYYRWFAN